MHAIRCFTIPARKRNQRRLGSGYRSNAVDIEAKVDDEFIERYGLSAGIHW